MAKVKNNLITNILNLVCNIVIGLIYTPYLVGSMGVEAYGIIPLALIINQYIGVVTTTLTNSFTRFYSVYIQKKEYVNASKALSTSLIVICAIVLLLCPFLIYLISDIDNVFSIPKQFVESAQVLFLFTVLSFFVSLVSSMLNVTAYAVNRLDVINYLNIARHISKPVLVVCFFMLWRVDVGFIGVVGFITEGLVFLGSIYFFYKYKPRSVNFNIKHTDKVIFYAIIGMSAWTLLHQCGDILLYRSDNLIINHYWGLSASGKVGAISVLGDYIRNIVMVIGSLFGPIILIAYSNNKHDEVQSLATTQSYVVGALSGILVGIAIGFSDSILNVWLGNDFVQYGNWLSIKLLACPFFASGAILAYVYRSWNMVKWPAICTILLGVVDVAIMVCLPYISSGEETISIVLVVCTIFAIIQSYYLNTYCVAKIYPDIRNTLFVNSLRIIVVVLVAALIAKGIDILIDTNNIFLLLFECAITGGCSLIFVYFVMMKKNEKNVVLKVLKS